MSLRDNRSHSRAALGAAAVFFSLSVSAPGVAGAQQPAAATTRPATHTVKRGDTLWDLAKLYLGDPFLWPEIYRLNTDQIEDPHWIYPGEVLKLPGESGKTMAAAPATAPAEPAVVTPIIENPVPAPPAAAPVDSVPLIPPAAPVPTVRSGEYIAAPWVDQRGGPRGSGYIIGARDVPGIASADRGRLSLYDAVVVSPPVGNVAPERELYLAYRMGPLIEDLGQIIVPTGVIEVTRSARNGEAAIGRLVKMFNEVLQGQRLIPLDSTAAVLTARPAPISNGKMGKVRWIYTGPVLPSLQSYVIIDISRRDVTTGDQIDLIVPRQAPVEGRDLALPEVWIGRAQVLRVTPYGATAIVTKQEQPKIEEGTAARVAAKMP